MTYIFKVKLSICLLWMNMFILKQLFFDSSQYSMIEIQIIQSILGKNYTCIFVDIIMENSLTFSTEYGNLISQRHIQALLQNQITIIIIIIIIIIIVIITTLIIKIVMIIVIIIIIIIIIMIITLASLNNPLTLYLDFMPIQTIAPSNHLIITPPF